MKICHLSAIKREFDGYDRYDKENVIFIDFEEKVKLEHEKMLHVNSKYSDPSYHKIVLRDATKEEVEKFLEHKMKESSSLQFDIEQSEKRIELLKSISEQNKKDILKVIEILNTYL